MAKLPKSIIKKYGISKKAWAVFRGTKRSKKPKVRRVTHMAKRRRLFTRKGSKGGMGFSLGNVVKIISGTALAVAYEVFVSPFIPLTGMIKNIVEMILGIILAGMRRMPQMVRSAGMALAIVNAYQLIYPLMSGMGGGSTTSGASMAGY